jgi:hypothetical protein
MIFDKNGAIIENIAEKNSSILGNSYVVMWDSSGTPIHINKKVINELYLYMTNVTPPTPPTLNNGGVDLLDPFID